MNQRGLYHNREEGGSAAVVCVDPKEYRTKRRLVTMRQFVASNPGLYSLSSVRKMIWKRYRNGLHAAGATVQISARRIFIDVDAWDCWMSSRTNILAADAPDPRGTRLSQKRNAKLATFRDMTSAPAGTGVSSTSRGRTPRE